MPKVSRRKPKNTLKGPNGPKRPKKAQKGPNGPKRAQKTQEGPRGPKICFACQDLHWELFHTACAAQRSPGAFLVHQLGMHESTIPQVPFKSRVLNSNIRVPSLSLFLHSLSLSLPISPLLALSLSPSPSPSLSPSPSPYTRSVAAAVRSVCERCFRRFTCRNLVRISPSFKG